MKLHGIDLGARFRAVERLWTGDGEALGEIRLSERQGVPERGRVPDASCRAGCLLPDRRSRLGASPERGALLQVGIGCMTLHASPGDRLCAMFACGNRVRSWRRRR